MNRNATKYKEEAGLVGPNTMRPFLAFSCTSFGVMGGQSRRQTAVNLNGTSGGKRGGTVEMIPGREGQTSRLKPSDGKSETRTKKHKSRANG